MSIAHQENAFETLIVERLVAGGYHVRPATGYDRARALDPEPLLAFVQATQPDRWAAFVKRHGSTARDAFLDEVVARRKAVGTLDLLRQGLPTLADGTFRLCMFPPANGSSSDLVKAYQANILSVVRQLRYSLRSERAIDLGIFVNGIPVATAELKNTLTGQDVADAVRQYKTDRPPAGEPILDPKSGALVHFALDEHLVRMTTRLANGKTTFLPFDRGRDGGSGNPAATPDRLPSSHLWEEVLQRDVWLEILGRFLFIDRSKNDLLIFPRWHQLESVRLLVKDARTHGPGRRYLIQHATGSGKSNTIAWTAQRLATLHGDDGKPVFDAVVVVSNRRNLDRQLQETLRQVGGGRTTLALIDAHSGQLRDALANPGNRIIVSTVQKFHTKTLGDMSARAGRRYAILIDEAHSGQSGNYHETLLERLASDPFLQPTTPEERLEAAQAARSLQGRITLVGFTATPTPTTLERFGTPGADGKPTATHLYSMRQSIEEGFSLDPLTRYMTYDTFYRLRKEVAEDPEISIRKGSRRLQRLVARNPDQIRKKAKIVIRHLQEVVFGRLLQGEERAMVVADSRESAVRWFHALRRLARTTNGQIRPAVAFSESISVDGQEYTEASLNGVPEDVLPEKVRSGRFNVLVVAEKYQTGYDEPRLVAMYVDRPLQGLQAVQTLSRLNRIMPEKGKKEVVVLDFRNTVADIQDAFRPYYETTILSEGLDAHAVLDLQHRLMTSGAIDAGEVADFADLYLDPALSDVEKRSRLQALVEPAIARWRTLPNPEDVRIDAERFRRIYGIICQAHEVRNLDLERLHLFLDWFVRRLPRPGGRPADDVPDIDRMVSLQGMMLRSNGETNASLSPGAGTPLPPAFSGATHDWPEDEKKSLSELIAAFNERHAIAMTPDILAIFEQARLDVEADPMTDAILSANPDGEDLRRMMRKKVVGKHTLNGFQRAQKVQNAYTTDPAIKMQIDDLIIDQVLRNKKHIRPPPEKPTSP
jgi:type I restriction enzyme R subunit